MLHEREQSRHILGLVEFHVELAESGGKDQVNFTPCQALEGNIVSQRNTIIFEMKHILLGKTSPITLSVSTELSSEMNK